MKKANIEFDFLYDAPEKRLSNSTKGFRPTPIDKSIFSQ